MERADQESQGWAGRILRVQPLPCAALGSPEAVLGSQWSGFHGILGMRGCVLWGLNFCANPAGFYPPFCPQPLRHQTCAFRRGLGAASLLCRCPLHLPCPPKPSRTEGGSGRKKQKYRNVEGAPQNKGVCFSRWREGARAMPGSAGIPWDRKSHRGCTEPAFPSRAGWELTGRAEGEV